MIKIIDNVTVEEIQLPQRKIHIRRGIKADDYWTYGEELGCDIWDELKSLAKPGEEPVCLWLPKKYIKENTSTYVQGVEVSENKEIPAGYDFIELPVSTYLRFTGEMYEDEHFTEAIGHVWDVMKSVDLGSMGYELDENNPRIQLEPIGTRGYIELLPVKKIER